MDRSRDSHATWVFGYGSLIWRPGFDYAERRGAEILGWSRRFWQGSTDHRGRADAPGRVVTLAPSAAAVCAGVAYRLEPDSEARVLAELDARERGGYDRVTVDIHLANGLRVAGSAYVASSANANYLGPAPLVEIAEQIHRASGPSGRNDEYVLRLASALRELGIYDPHVFALESILRLAHESRGDAGPNPESA